MSGCITEPWKLSGGLIHDEMAIHSELVTKVVDGIPRLICWVESAGEDGEHLRILKDGTVSKTLATQVLQVVFLGYSGFCFPIVHFPTKCVKVSELSIILSSLIILIFELSDWGFTEDYILQNVGEESRLLIKSNFEGGPIILGVIVICNVFITIDNS